MDSNKIKAIIIAVLATFAALYLGISAATAQLEVIGWVMGGLTLITCLLLGRRIWLLMPLLVSTNLSLRLPGAPDSTLLAETLVLSFCSLLLLMRQLPFRLKGSELLWWILILGLFVVQVYVRNPAGLSVFGGTTVGGRPYFLFAIALFTSILLSGLIVPPAELKTALKLSILGGLANLGISVLGHFIPTVGYWTGATYTNSGEEDLTNAGEAVDTGRATRVTFLSPLGTNIALWVSSFKSPLTGCLHPIWGGLILLSIAAAALSGFRNAVAMVALTYLVGLYYRGGVVSIFLSAIGGALALAILAIVNMASPLPPNFQRSLSFLPGTWEQRYIQDAEGSTEWRVEIWKEVLLTDRWITNKWLGDGLGFSARELAYQASLTEGQKRTGISGFDSQRESILASGDYHSGPVQTIRIIGYIGLAALLMYQFRLAVHAHRQIIRCKNTEWFPVSLFIGIPLIWNPIFFIFIFGDFKSAASTLLIGTAMVRLLENNLPLEPWRRRRPYSLAIEAAKPANQIQ